MEQKWQRRLLNQDYTSKGEISGEKETSASGIDPMLQAQLEEVRENNSPDAKTRETIDAKMRTGKKLSSAEMKYLQETDQAAYQKARELEMTRKKYEHDLKQCKTKEDVDRVRLSYAAQSMETVNSVSNNPNIPSGQKMQLIMAENQKMNAVADATQEFVRKGHYGRLPTEAEQRKAEKDMQEALKAEQEKRNDGSTSGTKSTEERQNSSASVTKDSGDGQNGSASDMEGSEKRSPGFVSGIAESEKYNEKEAPTRTEAEYSREAVRVRRARAKAVYEKNSGAAEGISSDVSAALDTKA